MMRAASTAARKPRPARRASGREGDSTDYRPLLPRPLGAELLTRQDMQPYPPDILITNYSMLNVMLNRRRRADDLRADRAMPHREPDNRFHLVVDELHSYKGTLAPRSRCCCAGCCTAWGSQPDSPKLRVLAASASLGDDRATRHVDYLRSSSGSRGERFARHPRAAAPAR